jgi:hypothetical protein
MSQGNLPQGVTAPMANVMLTLFWPARRQDFGDSTGELDVTTVAT